MSSSPVPGRRKLTPQQKKRYVLVHDRVDAWGESQKAARKNLPKKRARTHRAYRQAVKTELRFAEDADPGFIRRKRFDKWAGPSVAEHIGRQRDRQTRLRQSPRRSEQARQRRAARRSRTSRM